MSTTYLCTVLSLSDIIKNMGKHYMKISIEEETKILALLARGDTYEKIREQVDGRVTDVTIRAVKRRNKENLDIIRQKMMEKATDDAMSIKDKANRIISNKLNHIDANLEILNKAREDWLDDKIDYKEFETIHKKYKDVTLNELVTVSKEMHHQAVETEQPKAAPQDLSALVEAIKSGDQVKVTQVLFNGNAQ